MEENIINQIPDVYNDPYIIFALLNVNLGLIFTVENINQHLDMSNGINRLQPQVYAKNIFENCRSALDYMAYLIVKRYKIKLAENRIYFPIYDTEESFLDKKIIKDLQTKNKLLYDLLKNVQPFYQNDSYKWLNTFNAMNNKYKHRGFIPLEARFATDNGGWCAMSHGTSIGKTTLNLTEENTGIKTVTTTDFQNDRTNKFWFVFADNGEELVPFLRKITDETYKLIDKILKI